MNDLFFVKLVSGETAIIDAVDAPLVAPYTWYATGGKGSKYASRLGPSPERKRIFLHRELMGNPAGFVDHIDRNTMNCRRSNLRVVSKAINRINSRMNSNNTSGVRGVHWNKKDRRWMAWIRYQGERHYIGCFEQLETAAAAYNAKAIELFGESPPTAEKGPQQ